MVATLVPLPGGVAQAADTIQTLATSYQPTINEAIDASGFKHPGMGFTKETLENVRTQVRAQQEPWNTYFNSMLGSGSASKTPTIKNVSGDPTKPRLYGLTSQGDQTLFIADALVAYTQAILYYVTGDETYRGNAMRIIRLYAQMDPTRYSYYTDAHIHTGIPLSRMTAAAEILRYTSTQTPALAWTDDDTLNFTNNLVIPVMQTYNSCNCRFMNQHLYTTLAKMSGAIFTGNREEYDRAVEWFTVNKDAVDQGQTGSIKQLFRLVTKNDLTGEAVTPAVQHVEMGRDQAHGAGDITNAQILSRLMMGQGTKVDPVLGTPSTAPDAVGPYEFLDDRIFKAAELFGTFMQGYDIPWVPTASHTDADGNPTVVYRDLSGYYRGRIGQNTWESFYYYKYVRNMNMEQASPGFTRFFSTRNGYNWDAVDGGGDFWLFIPAAAASEGSKYLAMSPVDPYREVDWHFTPRDAHSQVMTDTTASYIRTTATEAGSKYVVYGYGYGTGSLSLRIRTNGVATMEAFYSTIQLPNTNGQWMYVNFPGSLIDFLEVTIKGAGTTVDFDHINVNGGSLSLPTFNAGNAELSIYSYVGTSQTVSTSFAATDSNPAATLTYQIDHLPPGASFNTSTGAFSWLPNQAGTHSFVVQASDGTTITSKRFSVIVGADRQATVNLLNGVYAPNSLYVSSTLATYNAANNDIASVISSATDEVFFQKLATLRSALEDLQLLTPVIADGSMNYAKMLLPASTFKNEAFKALDDDSDSFVYFGWAAGNRVHTLDFGPSFKISATAFALQARQSFPERVGDTTVYGSNDNANWTRLTPGQTVVTEDLQHLPVSGELHNQRFRFIKIAMSANSILELAEFHIFGTRYETVNAIASVTMSSDQALRRRVIPGNTVKVNFVSTEPINNVNVTIQGQAATVTTADNLNWTASAVINATAAPGNVGFLLNYKTAAGLDAEPTIFTTDGSGVYIADQTNFIGNLTTITTVSDSSGRNAVDAVNTANLLLDSNLNTSTDYRLNGAGWGAWVEFDFRGGGTVSLSRVEIIARPDQVARINGAFVQGSNDRTTWDTITNNAGNTADWQTLWANSATPYRYVRVTNGNNWVGNMSELRLYGIVKSSAQIATASISSAQSLSPASALNKRVVAGNTVKLTFTAKAAITDVTATIHGQAATVTTTDNVNFTATAVLAQSVAAGKVNFAVNYKMADGSAGYPATATTDGSGAYVVDESDLIRNISTVATLIDSTVNRSAAVTKSNVDALFDGNIFSASDFRIGSNNSGIGSYIIFDFKAGNQVNLTSVELLARQDQTLRAKSTVFQGSNDGSTWTAITNAAAQAQDWQTFAVGSAVPYRYIRIYNPTNWVGNLAEVRLHGSLHGADTTAPATQADAPGGAVNKDTTVTLSATDTGSGVQATYYAVDGGAQRTGNAILFNTEGNHSLVYWSVDWAGNIEPQRSASVRIDKTAPVTTATASQAAPASGWYSGDVSLALSVAADGGSPAAATHYTVDGGAQQTGNTVALSAKGTHTVSYWSVDQAGNTEQARSLTVNIGPIDLGASVKMTQQGATLNRATGKYVGGMTLTNTTGSTLTGPLTLRLNGLGNGLVLDNATGMDAAGAPYVALANPLAPGSSVTVNLTFSNPNRAPVTYSAQLFRGQP
ncbi:OmpL47-type beta-barrel domain-containing protein [Pseudoduganella namucuonensis]|nr:discoidin domain-containing protein [Pseudoduganella namucuonensis]